MVRTFDYQEYLASRDWALLKNQVRERSGGTCERCHRAPHQSTHHLTYARIGHELLEDLLGVCGPCHEYLSGKLHDDPAAAVTVQPKPVKPAPILNARGEQARVYLAGKIGKEDWRHAIFPELRGLVNNNDIEVHDISGGHHFYVGKRTGPLVPAEMEVDGLLYGGPYFVGCDHGGFHGEGTHGQGGDKDDKDGITCCATQGVWREYIAEECTSLISRSDVVFCWLDSSDAYGTIFELGFAHALKIPIVIAHPIQDDGWYWDDDAAPKWFKDMWLARYCANGVNPAKSAVEAWAGFVKYTAQWICKRPT